jgi:hypothetical protein
LIFAGALCAAAEPQRPEPKNEAPKKEAEVASHAGRRGAAGAARRSSSRQTPRCSGHSSTIAIPRPCAAWSPTISRCSTTRVGRNITSGEQFVTITKEKCQRQRDGIDFLSTRELVRESVKVYPLNNYGAIETGTHRFYAVSKGKPNRLTEVAQFTHVWKEEKTAGGDWPAC